MRKPHTLECSCKRCMAPVICRGCKDSTIQKELNYDGYCDDCQRAHDQAERLTAQYATADPYEDPYGRTL